MFPAVNKRHLLSGSKGSHGNLNADSYKGLYPTRLNFYRYPPRETISLEEFETLALSRLKILRSLETALLRKRSDDELKNTLSILEEENGLPLHHSMGNEIERLENERQKDNISHFVLRLAYARR
jgi:DNA primase large subunit